MLSLKTKRKYVWRTPRIDKKTGEIIAASGASAASATVVPPEHLHLPKVPIIDEVILLLLARRTMGYKILYLMEQIISLLSSQ